MRDWIRRKLTATEFTPLDGIKYWRELVYKNIILIITIVAFPGYLFGVYMSLVSNVYSIAILDTVVYLALIWLLIKEPFSLITKIYFLVSLPLIVGVSLILLIGPDGAGLSYLIGFVILTSILFGLKGAFIGLTIHFCNTLIVFIGLYFKLFSETTLSFYTPLGWLTIALNSFVVCSITSIPLSVIIQGLNKYIEEHNALERTLQNKLIQLSKAKTDAENANQLKSKFLANISHEVRTPLNVIMSFSEIVKGGMYRNTDERNQFLSEIVQNGHYLLNIIENILDISMIDTNQLNYNIKTITLETIFTEIEQIYKITNKRNVQIRFLHKEKPMLMPFYCDETRLKQVLINLINNAIKNTDKGEINFGYEPHKKGITCFVKDTGIGIHKKDLSTIFERFVKIENQNQFKQGTGLGLAISKSIVEALNGKIWVESKVNIGSTFFVYLPNQNVKVSSNNKG